MKLNSVTLAYALALFESKTLGRYIKSHILQNQPLNQSLKHTNPTIKSNQLKNQMKQAEIDIYRWRRCHLSRNWYIPRTWNKSKVCIFTLLKILIFPLSTVFFTKTNTQEKDYFKTWNFQQFLAQSIQSS